MFQQSMWTNLVQLIRDDILTSKIIKNFLKIIKRKHLEQKTSQQFWNPARTERRPQNSRVQLKKQHTAAFKN